jgi:hypothetical protein
VATISRYKVSAGVRFRVRYRTPDRRQTDKRGFKTKRDAEIFAATVEVKKLTGEYIAESAGRVTIGELAPVWLARKEQATAPSNYRMYESAWRNHVGPYWADRRLADVTVTDVEDWVTTLVRGGSGATTVLRAHGVLSGILGDAVKARRLAVNPAQGIDNLPRKTARRHVDLTADDLHRLADESGVHRPLVLTLGFCGTRWGETIALESAISSSSSAGCTSRKTPSNSASTTPLVQPRAVRHGQCQFLPSFSMHCRGCAATARPASWSSRA